MSAHAGAWADPEAFAGLVARLASCARKGPDGVAEAARILAHAAERVVVVEKETLRRDADAGSLWSLVLRPARDSWVMGMRRTLDAGIAAGTPGGDVWLARMLDGVASPARRESDELVSYHPDEY